MTVAARDRQHLAREGMRVAVMGVGAARSTVEAGNDRGGKGLWLKGQRRKR